MKKIITLFMALGLFAGAHAQSTKEEARRVILGSPKNTPTTGDNPRDVILGGGGSRSEYPNYPTERRRENGEYRYKKNKDKKYKKDNGKHLGWEKGKGNPHRNGGKHRKGKDD